MIAPPMPGPPGETLVINTAAAPASVTPGLPALAVMICEG